MSKSVENVNVILYDSTLRDGAQTPGVNLSVQDRICIAERLDKLGWHYVEGAFARSNDADRQFFQYMNEHPLKRAVLTAFGMTRRKRIKAEQDQGLQELLRADTKTVTLVGKASAEHIVRTLGVSLEENEDMIGDSIDFFRQKGIEVIFDAEHFYYGYRENPLASLAILKVAQQAGASTIVLCDTASGIMPWLIGSATLAAREYLENDTILGIHVHNDTGMANAATFEAVFVGARHVQGTVNGLGERTGNLDWCQWLPAAILINRLHIPDFDTTKIKGLSEFVGAISGKGVSPRTPFVGDDAFRHKAGMHVDALLKFPSAYNPIDPSLVGASVSYEHSDQGGSANVLAMATKFGFQLEKTNPNVPKLVESMDEARVLGDAQELNLLRKHLLEASDPFDVLPGTRIITGEGLLPEAMVKIRVNGDIYYEAASGKGGLHAFDVALKKALRVKYPDIDAIKLIEYRVILPETRTLGTDEPVIVEMKFSFNDHGWTSKVFSTDEASANNRALIDAYKYWILQLQKEGNDSCQ